MGYFHFFGICFHAGGGGRGWGRGEVGWELNKALAILPLAMILWSFESSSVGLSACLS